MLDGVFAVLLMLKYTSEAITVSCAEASLLSLLLLKYDTPVTAEHQHIHSTRKY